MSWSLRLEDRSLRVLATGLPGAAAVFRRCGFGLPGDCERSLADAVSASALSLPAMLGALEDLDDGARRGSPQDTDALIGFIVSRFHDRHRADLPALVERARALARDPAGWAGAPAGLGDLLDGLRVSLGEHMLREELRVFPLMRQNRRDRLGAALTLMRGEHDDNSHFLLRVDEITQGFRAPRDAGAAWQDLYADLERFANDLVAHVFLEDRVLFPRFETAA